jgi:hypothetical protein
MKDGKDGEAELREIYKDELFGYPQTKTFNGGRHVWMRVPEGCVLNGGVWIGKALEVKRNASVHVPPSMGYLWITELGMPEAVPLAPAWFLEAWAKAIPPKATVIETETFPEGQRHALLCSAAGSLRNLGLDEEGLFLALQGVRHSKCENPETISDSELRSIAKSFSEKEVTETWGMRLARGDERALAVEAFFNRKVEVKERPKTNQADLPVLSSECLRPTPLIAAWVDWVVSCAPRPQPELALLAACVGIGGLIGRQVTFRGAHANIYGLGLASSGSGKDAPLHSVAAVYKACGAGDMLGASKIGSDAGMLQAIGTKQSIVWPLDEISILLENMGKPNCPGYITGITQYLLELSSCRPHNGIELKGIKPDPIMNPFPCILTFAQPATFARVYNEKMTESGLLGRFIPFLGEDLPDLSFDYTEIPPPADMIESIRAARAATPIVLVSAGPTRAPVPMKMEEGVKEHYKNVGMAVEKEMQAIKNDDRIYATLLARTMEKANKFAMVHAWSTNPIDPIITTKSIDWAVEVVRYSNECMRKIIIAKASTPHGGMVDKIVQAVARQGGDGVSHGRLINLTLRHIEPHKREGILNDLVSSGAIIKRVKRIDNHKGVVHYFSNNNEEQP